jgi:hypothetical protein
MSFFWCFTFNLYFCDIFHSGATIWICISFIWALWMAMWASQCNSHSRDAERSQSILPLSDVPGQQGVEVALAAAKEKALAMAPVATYQDARAAERSTREGDGKRNDGGKDGGKGDDEPLCAVCLTAFEGGMAVRVTVCQHVFCADCLDAFISQCRSPAVIVCPLCRHPLAEASVSCVATGASPGVPTPADSAPSLRPPPRQDGRLGTSLDSTHADLSPGWPSAFEPQTVEQLVVSFHRLTAEQQAREEQAHEEKASEEQAREEQAHEEKASEEQVPPEEQANEEKASEERAH